MRQGHIHGIAVPVLGPDGARIAGAAVASLIFSAVVVATALDNDTSLGAPHFWPWLLTGLQVLALWSAGAGRWWGWLLGCSVQLPWIAYAIMTTQYGFIPGCAASATVQLLSYARQPAPKAVRPVLRLTTDLEGAPNGRQARAT
jgi:hypothetical protein